MCLNIFLLSPCSGFEDDDFKDPEAALANAGKPKLLSQYDETKGPKKEIVLGEKGTARAEKPGSVKKVDLEGRKVGVGVALSYCFSSMFILLLWKISFYSSSPWSLFDTWLSH